MGVEPGFARVTFCVPYFRSAGNDFESQSKRDEQLPSTWNWQISSHFFGHFPDIVRHIIVQYPQQLQVISGFWGYEVYSVNEKIVFNN